MYYFTNTLYTLNILLYILNNLSIMGYCRVEQIDSRSKNKINPLMVFDTLNDLYVYCVTNDIVMSYYKVIEFVCTSRYAEDDVVLGYCCLSYAFNDNLKSLNFTGITF